MHTQNSLCMQDTLIANILSNIWHLYFRLKRRHRIDAGINQINIITLSITSKANGEILISTCKRKNILTQSSKHNTEFVLRILQENNHMSQSLTTILISRPECGSLESEPLYRMPQKCHKSQTFTRIYSIRSIILWSQIHNVLLVDKKDLKSTIRNRQVNSCLVT